MIIYEDGLINFMLHKFAKSLYHSKKIGYYYIQNSESITIKPMLNYDNNMKFIFLQLKLIFENTKNNQYEKDMANFLS
jgi:hypothetical protein